MTAPRLALGFPMLEQCFSHFTAALLQLELPPPSELPRRCEIGSIVSDSRNKLVRWFLEDTSAERLVMVDQDHRLPRNLLERIANYSEPVVGALYYGRHAPHSPIVCVPNPRWQDPAGEPSAPVNLWNDPATWKGEWRVGTLTPLWPSLEESWRQEGGLNRVLVVGGGCLSIRRDVLEDWPAKQPYFDFGHLETGEVVGEDVWFMRQCARQGVPVWVDAGVVIPHMTCGEITHRDYRAHLQRRALELGITA